MSPQEPPEASDVAWLGHGLETLIARRPHLDPDWVGQRPPGFDYDLVIVGSGYGAAVAAHEFAGCRPAHDPAGKPISIGILERGAEYLRGAFPSRMADLAGHVRFSTGGQTTPRGVRSGLFDVRVGGDATVVVANGVGGGSLINAGVMLQPNDEVFRSAPWPRAVREDRGLDKHFDAVRPWLGAVAEGRPNTVEGTPSAGLKKYLAMGRLGAKKGGAVAVPISVALKPDRHSMAGVPLEACIGCGDCATGCNHGAKDSLDVGLLAQACETDGVELTTGATVLWVERLPGGAGWAVVVQHTDDKLRLRQHRPLRLRARRVILAGGTLGSTEILLRSQQRGLPLSPTLGSRFSANGDLIASLHGQHDPVDAVASDDRPPREREIGPTITAMVDLRQGNQGFVIQDLAVPGPLRRAFEELYTLGSTLQRLPEGDCRARTRDDADECAVDADVIRRSLPVAMIGHDASDGRLVLVESETARRCTDPGRDAQGDGALRIVWPRLKDDERWPVQHDVLAGLLKRSGLGGRLLPNPGWQLLPGSLQGSLGIPNGPLLTVHPLGGCAMGDDATQGVVDHVGRVFDPRDPALLPELTYDGLVVLDGAIVPASLGVNPALTIAALARRAAQQLRTAWGLGDAQPHCKPLGPRPVYRRLAETLPTTPTSVELIERMRGKVRFASHSEPYWIELTLFSKPSPLRDLMRPQPGRRFDFDPDRSTLRLLRQRQSDVTGPPEDRPDEKQPAMVARIDGSLCIFEHEPTRPVSRTWRALRDWFFNRGLRDIVQSFRAGSQRRGTAGEWRSMLRALPALASRAGTARCFDYRFTLTQVPQEWRALFPEGMQLGGRKTLRYGRAASPLRQLMEMTLSGLPREATPADPVLSLHLPFFAEQKVPLLRVVEQQDQPSALVDLAAFAGYVARILVEGHLWTFRKPDAASTRPPQRLPGPIAGVPPPEIIEVEVATMEDARIGACLPVHIRLTRYRGKSGDASPPPVLLIHGYSASGTTFAHPTLEPGLMPHLVKAGRDVWILDLRSSCGMPTAGHGWAFEDMGCEDIPVAVEHVCRTTGAEQVDIVAHCMGVAMLFMGLLGEENPGFLPPLGRHEALRRKLWDRDGKGKGRGRIRRLVMSQVGPAVQLTPANVARAYVMRYAKQFIGGRYEFRAEGEPGLADQLLDRLLAAMPYPDGEFGLENPFLPPAKALSWVGTRHRIDALFGRVFNLRNMSPAVLERIADFFGPFSVDTVSQVMHFVRYRLVTDRSGFNRFVAPARMRQRLTFPMLSLHAPANGLADADTKQVLDEMVAPHLGAGGSLESLLLGDPSLGHQDSLIGVKEAEAWALNAIATFLAAPGAGATTRPARASLHAATPSLGVRLWVEDGKACLHVANEGGRGVARRLVLVPVSCAEPSCLKPTIDLAAIYADEDARVAFRALHGRKQAHSLPSPATERFASGEWTRITATSPWVLVVALYDQCDPGGVAGDDWKAEVVALEELFKNGELQCNPAWVRRGIVYLAPGTLTDAAQAPAPMTFVLASCQYPAGLVDSTPPAYPACPAGPADASLLRLRERLKAWGDPRRPSLLVLAGDQIYADATAGLFDPRAAATPLAGASARVDEEWLRVPYQNWLGSVGAQSVLGIVPSQMQLDDHEIDDNWEPLPVPADPDAQRSNERLREAGVRAYARYQRNVPGNGPLVLCWRTHVHRGWRFFMADTRTERGARKASQPVTCARIMGCAQTWALTQWLQAGDPSLPAFVVSPSMLLPRRRTSARSEAGALQSDAWDGYPGSLHALLGLLWRVGRSNVVFLSGDEHLACVARATVTDVARTRSVTLHSIHSSALYAPYPFANSVPEDFAASDGWAFEDPGAPLHRYCCKVEVLRWAAGDGFATLSLAPRQPDWELKVAFDRRDDAGSDVPLLLTASGA